MYKYATWSFMLLVGSFFDEIGLFYLVKAVIVNQIFSRSYVQDLIIYTPNFSAVVAIKSKVLM